jgi:divalent metal cation (Fe/Co/Zn/Cd) transporter
VSGVRGVHDLKVRASGGRYHMELHVVVDGGLSVRQGHAIAKRVEACLVDEEPLVEQVTIHVDPR